MWEVESTLVHAPVLGIVLNLLVRELTTNETLEGEDGVCRVDDGLALSGQTNKTFAVLGEGDNGGCCSLTLGILDDTRSLALHDSDARVGRTQVDTNDGA